MIKRLLAGLLALSFTVTPLIPHITAQAATTTSSATTAATALPPRPSLVDGHPIAPVLKSPLHWELSPINSRVSDTDVTRPSKKK